VARQYSYVWYF